jgi:hypothetical protein
MKTLIACCGINCESCDARVATLANNPDLREETAEKWREMYQSPDITAEMINCTGCRIDGAKFGQCELCEIRNCVKDKGVDTCGACPEMNTCPTIAPVFQHVPDAKENLAGCRISQ